MPSAGFEVEPIWRRERAMLWRAEVARQNPERSEGSPVQTRRGLTRIHADREENKKRGTLLRIFRIIGWGISMSSPFRFLAAFLLFASAAFCQAAPETANLQHQDFEVNLPSGANLRLHLRNGDFRVVGSDSQKISVHVEGKNLGWAKDIKIQLKRSDGAVDLKLSHVPKNELQVTIRVPKSTNLYARMRGGDLSVEGVAGDKDLELTGGDLTIQVEKPEEYSHVDLSVRFGDVSGNQFGDPKGWLGNSVRKEGSGKYRLHAHVMAGDLVLKSES